MFLHSGFHGMMAGVADDFADFLADLDQQAEAQFAQDRALEVAERARAAYSEVSLESRLLASLGLSIRAQVQGAGALGGVIRQVGEGWFELGLEAQTTVIVTSAVTWISGLADASVAPALRPIASRRDLSSALRSLAESGVAVTLIDRSGAASSGLLGRVGEDFFEVLTLPEPTVFACGHLAVVRSN